MKEKMSFNNWEEASNYILENFDKSCLNCTYGTKGDITTSEFVFCTEPINGMLMANLYFGIVCQDWKGCEGNEI